MFKFLQVVAVIGLLSSAGASAGGNMVRPLPGLVGVSPHASGQEHGWNRPGGGPESGNWRDHDHQAWMFRRIRQPAFVYVRPVYVQQQYVGPGQPEARDDETGYETVDQAPIRYIAMPTAGPPTPPVAAAPPKPAQVVSYATTGQPINIPTGARVTRGSVYKYTRDGITTYTNVPPPDGARAKLLFGYTEAVSTAAAHTLYRCAGSKPGSVGYSEAPVPNQDCKVISYAEPSLK